MMMCVLQRVVAMKSSAWSNIDMMCLCYIYVCMKEYRHRYVLHIWEHVYTKMFMCM